MLTVDQIAKSIRATRGDFGNVFLQAQVGLPIGDRVQFEAVGRSANNEEAFREALAHAQLKGWFDVLIDAIIANGLQDGRLSAELSNASPDIQLQAMINYAAGFMEPHIVSRGLDYGCRWTGKITVDGNPRGTGILIANNRLLTAWHVVKELFDLGNNGYEANPNSGARLEVIFSDYLQLLGRDNGLRGRGERRVKAHLNWCVFFSDCHDAELALGLPPDLEALEGHWDYAIIRLAEPIGFERGWAVPDERATVPRAQEKMLLLQHPAGQSIRLGCDDIADPDAAQKMAIPKFRFLHYVNALKGSSGGPCFDKSLTLFGFHQGEWNGAARVTNRGVPIVRVLEHLKDKYGVDRLEPEDSLIWNLGAANGMAPVIGCEDFQQQMLHSTLLHKPRIFTIRGDKGRGKTFLASVVSAMLPDGEHLKIELSAVAISTKNATEIANMICSKAGAGTLQLEQLSEIFSTPAVWLKDEVLRKLIEAIDRMRNGRLVWLTLTNLNAFDITGDQATELLLLLYEQVKILPWIRIVLDGMRSDIPGSLREMEYRHRVGEITRAQIETYLRRLATHLNLDLGGGIQLETQRLFRKYEDDLNHNSEEAAHKLAAEINNVTAPNFAALTN